MHAEMDVDAVKIMLTFKWGSTSRRRLLRTFRNQFMLFLVRLYNLRAEDSLTAKVSRLTDCIHGDCRRTTFPLVCKALAAAAHANALGDLWADVSIVQPPQPQGSKADPEEGACFEGAALLPWLGPRAMQVSISNGHLTLQALAATLQSMLH